MSIFDSPPLFRAPEDPRSRRERLRRKAEREFKWREAMHLRHSTWTDEEIREEEVLLAREVAIMLAAGQVTVYPMTTTAFD